MTNEEAINVINTWIEPMRNTLKGELTHEFLDAVEVLKKQAISDKTSDKYRWHDLRKDPTDLPKVGEHIVYMFTSNNSTLFNTVRYDKHYLVDRKGYKYVAWKYIEPFEDGKK